MTYSYFQEPSRNESVLVGTSSVVVSEFRHEQEPRKVIVIRNISPDPLDIISIAFGLTQAVANNGIVLRQYESFTETTDAGYQCFQGSITAICATANGKLSIMER